MKNTECKCINIDLLNSTGFYGHFIFTSLDKGEGTTLGNMLRRTLLLNLYGFKITGIKISGVSSEFISLEGVREDILEILLNLKQINFSNENKTKQCCLGYLKCEGPAIITAGELVLPNGIKVVNPTSHLFTITDTSIIEFGVKIEYGQSYVLAKDHSLNVSKGYIPIDSNFSPILKVNFFSKSIPFDVKKKEELHLEIFTNGSILPDQALFEARNMLGYMLAPIKNIDFSSLNLDKNPKEETNYKKYLDIKKISESLKDDGAGFQADNLSDLISEPRNLFQQNILKELASRPPLELKNQEKLKEEEKLKKEEEKLKKEEEKRKKEKKINNNIKLSTEEELLEKVSNMAAGSLKELKLSNRIIKLLNNSGIQFSWELAEYPMNELDAIEGLDLKSIEKIKRQLTLYFEEEDIY